MKTIITLTVVCVGFNSCTGSGTVVSNDYLVETVEECSRLSEEYAQLPFVHSTKCEIKTITQD